MHVTFAIIHHPTRVFSDYTDNLSMRVLDIYVTIVNIKQHKRVILKHTAAVFVITTDS